MPDFPAASRYPVCCAEHESPIDWFSFEPRAAGDHFVRVASTGKDRCGDLWSGFAPSGNDDQRYDRTDAEDAEVQVFGPIRVSEEEIGQTKSFYIACEALIWDTAYSLAITAPGSDTASEAPTSDPGEEAEDIPERIKDIVEAEEAGEGFSWWWLVLITIGGLGFWHFNRRFRPKDDAS